MVSIIGCFPDEVLESEGLTAIPIDNKVNEEEDTANGAIADDEVMQEKNTAFDIARIIGVKFYLSFEESDNHRNVFRPEQFDFPISWPRPGFRFNQNGHYTFFDPAPNDAGLVETSGEWQEISRAIFALFKEGKLVDIVSLEGGPEKIISSSVSRRK